MESGDVMTGIRAGESIRIVAYCEGCKHLLLLAQKTRPIFEAIYRNNDVKVDLAVEELEDLYLKARRDTKESIRG